MQTETKSPYTYEATVEQINEVIENDPASVYKCKYVNRKGIVSNSNKRDYFTEVIAKQILADDLVILPVDRIDAKGNYKPYAVHSKPVSKINPLSNRLEEIKAINLFEDGLIGNDIKCSNIELGRVVEYQVPVKGVRSHSSGKIDLISYNESKFYLIELKFNGNKDTLLRAVLELETYSRQINVDKLIKELKARLNIKVDCFIEKALLLYPGCNAFDEYSDINKRPEINKLIKKYNIHIAIGVDEASK
jgi:hypothetical protein